MYASPSPAFSFVEMKLDKFATTSEPVEVTIVQVMQYDAKAISQEFAAFIDNLSSVCFDQNRTAWSFTSKCTCTYCANTREDCKITFNRLQFNIIA